MTDPLGTLPMFPPPEPTPVAKPYNDVSAGHGPIRYAKYRPKNPVKCDDCLGALAAAGGNGPATRPAAFKRTQAGANTLLLCHEHTALRKGDEMP